jgi:hypothetical protein
MAEFKMPTQDEARAEFWRVKAEFEKRMAAARPSREAYEAKRAEIERIEKEELEPLRQKMHEAEEGCHDLQQRMATLARFVKHQVGAPPKDVAA